MATTSPFEPTVLGAIWRYRWLTLLITVVTTALAFSYTYVSPASYEAVGGLVVEDPQTGAVFNSGNIQSPQRYVADQAAILGSDLVAELAVENEESLKDVDEVVDGLVIFWDQNLNLIEVSFTSDDPDSAVAGANAVAEAYSDLRLETSSASFAAALAQLDGSIAEVDVQLLDLQSQIEARLSSDPSRVSLNEQLSDALARLVILQEELPDASGDNLIEVRDQLDDVLQQIQTLQSLNNLQTQDPDLAALLQEQQQTVSRKGDLLQRKDELGVEARLESTGIVLYSPAIAAEEVGVDLIRAGAVGLVLGLLIAGGTTYLLALKRRKFDDRSQPGMVFNAPLIAEVPNFRDERIKGDIPVTSHPASVSAEAFRFISSALEVEADQGVVVTGNAAHLADVGRLLIRSVAFVSPSLDDGKTVVTANTALASARHGKRVLAIDADFGHQRLTALLAGDNAPNLGLTDLVERDVSLDRVICSVPMKEGTGIDLVSRGTVATTAPDFFRSAAAKAFFEAIKLEYDLVLIDTPPLLHVAYASPLVRYADRVVVILRHRTSVAPAEELADRLAFLETGLAGYVYNRAPLRHDMSRSESSLEDVLGRAGRRQKSG